MGQNFELDTLQKRRIELINIIIYSIYGLTMMYIIFRNDWEPYLFLIIFILMVTGWAMYLAQYRSYRFRTFIVAFIMQISVLIYSLQSGSLPKTLYTIISVSIIMGLYGIPEMSYLSLTSSTLIILLHTFVLKTVNLSTDMDVIHFVFQVLAIYVVQFIVFYYEKTHIAIQNRMESAIEELTYAEKSKDNFLANVSHELRTPINTICGMSEILLKEELPGETRNDLFQVQMAGRNLHSIVSDIFDYYELEYGNITLMEEEYNISSTINNIINMTMARKNDKKIEVVMHCDSDIPYGLVGDEVKLRRVIVNIINNAIKFTEEGCISISIGCRRESYGVNLIVSVKDTGIGMKQEDLEKICKSFYQADMGWNRQRGGIGIGLSISHALIQKMGGFLSVNSEYGRGTTVQFVVPQKVSDDRPMISIKNPKDLNVLCYVNLEFFELKTVRDEYSKNIQKLVEQNGVRFHMCKNLAELMRRLDKGVFTHVFISLPEYDEDRQFFDELSIKICLIIIVEQGEEQYISNTRVRLLYKPFFILPIAMILNDEEMVQGLDENSYHHEKFIAPDVKILAVDDNEINLMVLKGLLAPYKIMITTVNSGQEALRAIEDKSYDLILLDHMMPEMDGVECFHRIREKPESYFKNIPIIALTANAIGGAREQFMDEGFQDFVAKPIEISVLARVLRRNIPASKIIEVDSYDFEVQKQADGNKKTQSDSKENERDKKESLTTIAGLPDIVDQGVGVTYCGTRENLEAMLKMHCEKYEENRNLILQAYEKENWKDYGTHVHGIKSTMMSVGLKKLSQEAKNLELASKENDIEFIYSHHNSFMELYAENMRIISGFFGIHIVEEKKEVAITENYEEITLEEYEQFISDFEGIVYTFDGEKMMELVHSLDRKSCNGHSLEKELQTVVRKIEMTDYMSALDYITKLKGRLV